MQKLEPDFLQMATAFQERWHSCPAPRCGCLLLFFLSSFIPSRVRQHRKRPKSGFKYLRPGLPQGTVRADSCQEQLPATLPATTASLLSVCRWIGWTLETKKVLIHAPWKPPKNAFPTEPLSWFPSMQALSSPPLWYKVLPFRSQFAAAVEIQESENRWAAAHGWDTDSTRGATKQESLPGE